MPGSWGSIANCLPWARSMCFLAGAMARSPDLRGQPLPAPAPPRLSRRRRREVLQRRQLRKWPPLQ